LAVLSRTPDRLRIRSLGRRSVFATFDRAKREARIWTFGVSNPLRYAKMAFSEIEEVIIGKRENTREEASYRLVLRHIKSRNVYISTRSRNEALEILQQLRGFLEL
jgi:hypothetical protein